MVISITIVESMKMSKKTEYHEIMDMIRTSGDVAKLRRVMTYINEMKILCEDRIHDMEAHVLSEIRPKFTKAYHRVTQVAKLERAKDGLSVAVMRNQIREIREMNSTDRSEFFDLLSRRGWRYRPSINTTGKRTWVYFPPKSEIVKSDGFEY